jgi:hypothetical protein
VESSTSLLERDLLACACTLTKDLTAALSYYEKGNDVVLFHDGPDDLQMAERHDKKKGLIMFCEGQLGACRDVHLRAMGILMKQGVYEFDDTLLRLDNNNAVATCAKRPVF